MNNFINKTMNNKMTFKDFHNFDALMAEGNMSEQLIKTYQNIFGDPDLWGESYSQSEVEEKLKDELSGNAGLRLCINDNDIDKGVENVADSANQTVNDLLGFCWAQQLGLQGVKSAIESIQFYQDLGCPKILEPLKRILDDKPVLYVHDLGISKDYRGQVPLHKLICPVLNSLAERSQTSRLFFWSIKESRIYKLAQYAGFKQVANIAGMQFFIGDVKPCSAF
ncbi:hypothetical protein OO007_12010 [Cocleimonas sp. KMM 6892]|uniref:hypothetical protein n=1 Tax=unclassified Cocleimonas TaxID=2639732 RepID=UPI002DBF0556|nr:MULTISPECIES: hypothetical protein [unclassified Cocleimonas]MEB8432953.1 hypothetical protein [Cocleimonas sp. KMM 6892]MEC4716066.1 hypothetical protein [Cocleimonas sp. KMM 6895]MEC4745527.1 hypothetical protein [Cocleimonas sp. KMM 6896]